MFYICTGDRKEKQRKAIWQCGSNYEKFTAVAADVLKIFKSLQKEAQRTFITFPYVLVARDVAVQKLKMIETTPYPGGSEKKLVSRNVLVETEDSRRSITHEYVTKSGRSFPSIQQKCILSAKQFLTIRLNNEQQPNVQIIINVANANNAGELISNGRRLVRDLFGE